MGFALAEAAARRGHRVTLVHGPVGLSPPPGVRAVPVVSAAEMLSACRTSWPRQDILIKAAAVADYAPKNPIVTKRKKSGGEWRLPLRPTEDILADLSLRRRSGQVVIGFALEDEDERNNALRKLTRKKLDAIVLNRPVAIGSSRAALEVLVSGKDWQIWPAASKSVLARKLVQLAERLWGESVRSSS